MNKNNFKKSKLGKHQIKKNNDLCGLLGQLDSAKDNLRKVCVTLHIKIQHLDTTCMVVLMQFEKQSVFLIKEKTFMPNN